MGWDTRRYAEGGRRRRGNGESVIRRIFGDGENPFDWALPLYTAWGIRVRIHLVFIIMIAAELLLSLPKDALEWQSKALSMGGLFLFVLLHEYGHCIACRRVGGTADQILMWPLGGLAFCAPPHHWKADLVTTLGGPLVNLLFLPIFGGALYLLGQGTGAVVFNPFNPGGALLALHVADGTRPFWLVAIWWCYYINLVLFSFNMVLVMFPMDAGRIVNALMWRRMGYRKAMSLTLRIGIVFAIALFIAGMVKDQSRLTAVACFGLIACLVEKRRLAMTVSDPALAGYDFERGFAGMPDPDADEEEESPRAIRARDRQRRQDDEDQSELDRILAKIARSGMGSLSGAEKRWLERATERRRRG